MEVDNLKNRKSRNGIPESQTVINNIGTKKQPQTNKADKKHDSDEFSFLTKNMFMIILTVRTVSVCFNLIWDCDEVFNYWEPLHYILFGNGFQTWEYSPEFSLRSYLYIYLHALPIWPFKWLVSSKITLFYMLRFFLAFISSKVETFLFYSLIKVTKSNKSYEYVPFFYILLSLTNAGMFLSITTFLPSTFSMYLVMLAYGAWVRKSQSKLAIFSIGMAVLMGWPFVIILGIPIALDMIYSTNVQKLQQNVIFFIKWTIFFGLLIITPLVIFDSHFFGKTVLAPLNIVMYNVFPSNPNGGPDLYGTEPLSYYLVNCVLNFNILAPIFVVSIAFLIFADKFYLDISSTTNSKLRNSFLVIFFAVFLWVLVFFTRPHKEERFLYPIYSLLLILASVVLSLTRSGLKKVFKSTKIGQLTDKLPHLIILIHAVISLMRIVALFKNFSSSVHVYEILNKPEIKFNHPILESKENINVCVEKEWYRFPSSFFIPENLDETAKKQTWRMKFIESSFKGQLPGNFNENLSLPDSTRFADPLFNDDNKEVRERYIKMNKCDFFIDTDTLHDDVVSELSIGGVKTKWRTVAKLPFIDMGSKSDRFLRAFYVPYLYETKVLVWYEYIKEKKDLIKPVSSKSFNKNQFSNIYENLFFNEKIFDHLNIIQKNSEIDYLVT